MFQEDETSKFLKIDTISNFEELNSSHSRMGFIAYKSENYILYYNLVYHEDTGFPEIKEAIKIDRDLRVYLQHESRPVPLPTWLIERKNGMISRHSMLQNLPGYIRNKSEEHSNSILDELQQQQYYKPKGRPPYSAEMMRFALLLRYTLSQSYKYLLDHFSLPSFSTINKLKQGELDSLKALQLLKKAGKIWEDIVLMADEMYLQKSSQYHSGEYVGADKEGNLYKGIVVFMVVGLKKSVPIVINAFPETAITGDWIASKLDQCLSRLSEEGFKVRGIVTDNHSGNVKAFHLLTSQYPSDNPFCIKHPKSVSNTYLFFDNVHLMKNISNNLLNAKKFVFPEFSFPVMQGKHLDSDGGYICWSDLHAMYDKDLALQGNLRKAPKLTYSALHPGNNKQSVPLALAIFDETTIAAFKSYFPERKDVADFLTLINSWWTVVNARTQFTSNPLANAPVQGDGKADFLRFFAYWLEK